MKGLSQYFENHFEIKGLFAKNSIIVKINFTDIDIVVEVKTWGGSWGWVWETGGGMGDCRSGEGQ